MSETTKSEAHSIWPKISTIIFAIYLVASLLFFLHRSSAKRTAGIPPQNTQVGITWLFVPPSLLDLLYIAYASWNGPIAVVPLLQYHWPCWCWRENWPICWLTDTWRVPKNRHKSSAIFFKGMNSIYPHSQTVTILIAQDIFYSSFISVYFDL